MESKEPTLLAVRQHPTVSTETSFLVSSNKTSTAADEEKNHRCADWNRHPDDPPSFARRQRKHLQIRVAHVALVATVVVVVVAALTAGSTLSAATTTSTAPSHPVAGTKFQQQHLPGVTSKNNVPHFWNDEIHAGWMNYLLEEQSSANDAAASLLGAKATTTNDSASQQQSLGGPGQSFLYFNQTRAFERLNPSTDDFFRYQSGWEAQITQALCAIATTAAVLNSMRDMPRFSQDDSSSSSFILPTTDLYRPFPWATQDDILSSADDNECVRKALGGTLSNRDAVYHMGLGLAMVPRVANCFLETNGYRATPHPAKNDQSGGGGNYKESIKELLVQSLADPLSRVLLNYDRGGMGQGPPGHGHWSPLGSHDPRTDTFLVMDVAKYKHPMVWVGWEDLWAGAATVDTCGETLALPPGLDWDLGYKALISKVGPSCIPGNRGFVVIEPIAA